MHDLSRYSALYKMINNRKVTLLAISLALGGVAVGVLSRELKKLTRPRRMEITFLPETNGLKAQDFEAFTKEGKKVSGWLILPEDQGKPKTDQVVVFCHGYGQNRSSHPGILNIARNLVMEEGKACILFDFRNHGLLNGEKTSDDGITTVGVKTEKEDLHAVLDLAESWGLSKKSLIGVSMGAATSLQVAAEREDVEVVIADSSFTDLENYLKEQISAWHPALKGWMISPLLHIFSMTNGIDLKQMSPMKAVRILAQKGVIVRFVHTIEDQITPNKHSKELAAKYTQVYNQANTPPLQLKDVLKLAHYFKEDPTQLRHCRSIDADPAGYIALIKEAIQYLGKVRIRRSPTRKHLPQHPPFTSIMTVKRVIRDLRGHYFKVQERQ